MTEHPTEQQLDEYCRRVIAPATFLSIHRHVTVCPRCATLCESPEQLPRDLRQLHEALISSEDDTPYHLPATEMVAYVQGTLDEIDLEIAESHLGTCSTCLSEVQRRTEEVRAVTPERTDVADFKPRRQVSSPLMNRWTPWRVAAAVFLGAAVILSAIWMLRTRPAETIQQEVRHDGVSSPQSSATAEVQGPGAPELSGDVSTPDGSLKEGASPDTQFAVVLNDGGQKVTMDARGTLTGLERLPLAIQEKVGAALLTGKVEQPAELAQLAGQWSTLLGTSENGVPFQLLRPVGQVVRSAQPTFQWSALAGAQNYKVVVTDVDLNPVASSPQLHTTEWRITNPLRPGAIYTWQVTALKDGVSITSPVMPAPQAKFRVLDRSTSRVLRQAERAYPASHLTLGVLYAQAGLLDEAEKELVVLVRNNPNARVAERLLRSVEALRAAQALSSSRRS